MKKNVVDSPIEILMNLLAWGTPGDYFRSIETYCHRIVAETYIGVFSFAEIARGNIALSSEKIMPKLKTEIIIGLIDWAA